MIFDTYSLICREVQDVRSLAHDLNKYEGTNRIYGAIFSISSQVPALFGSAFKNYLFKRLEKRKHFHLSDPIAARFIKLVSPRC